MSEETVLQLFVSSPGDVRLERERIDAVVERLNAEYAGRARIRTIRWETRFYSSHDTFQAQIPEAADCDLVLAVFGARLGSPLPESFPPMPDGARYPSGTAYEILSAMEARRRGKGIPDIYVFRRPTAPLVALDAVDRAEIESQWRRLTDFFETWFRARSGEFLAAFQEFATTDEFAAKVEDCLRQWLARRGFPPESVKWDRARLGSPYPGLDAFDEARRTVFFGRRVAIEQALRRIRDVESGEGETVPFVLLIGASGSGKSSLLRAGVLPRLGRPGAVPEIDLWRRAVIVPGLDPFAALADALLDAEALGPELAATPLSDRRLLAKQLAADPDVALAPLAAALAAAAEARRREAGFDTARPARLFLAVDQAERLLIETAPETRFRFAALLAEFCRARFATVFVVLRSDAYPRFQAVETLVALKAAGASLDLGPPTAAELEEMATGPAAISVPPLVFERRDGRSLAARLVADARGGDALPLLQMTLARLAAAESTRGDGVLRLDDYHGLGEAVTRTAAAALDGLDAEARAALPALIVGLVRDYAVDAATGEPAPVIGALDRGRFEAAGTGRRALVETFVAHRLLTAEGDAAAERVRPTHESLLRIWPEAVAILTEAAHLVRARAAIEPLARDWAEAAEADKERHLDVSPALLEAAAACVARFGDDVPETVRRFVAAAEAEAAARREAERIAREARIADAEAIARAKTRQARTTGLGLAAALVLAGLAAWQWHLSTLAGHEAERQRDRAEHALKAATATADGLVFDLAQKFRNVSGVPKPVIRDILDQARRLQEQLIDAGEKNADLGADHGAALGESAETELVLGDLAVALAQATRSRDVYADLARSAPNVVKNVFGLALGDDLIGRILARYGRAEEADAARVRAEATLEAAIGRGVADPRLPQLLATVREDRGVAARERGDRAAAIGLFRSGLDLTVSLLRDRPNDMALRHNLAVAHRNLGDVALTAGDVAAADADFSKASEIAAGLAREFPENSLLQRDFTLSQERLGETLTRKGDLSGALKAFVAGQETALRLSASDPADLDWRYDVAIGHREIGDARQALGDLPGAADAFAAALAVDLDLVARDPGNDPWRRHLDDVRQRLSVVREKVGDGAGALALAREALAFATATRAAGPADPEWRRRTVQARRRLAALLIAADAAAEAGPVLAEAIAEAKSAPLDAADRVLVAGDLIRLAGIALLDGDAERSAAAFAEAEATLRPAVAADGKDAAARGELALLLVGAARAESRLGRHAEAIGGLEEAIRLLGELAAEAPDGPWRGEIATAEDRLGDARDAAGDRPGAIAAYRASLAATLSPEPTLAGALTREALAPLLEAEKRPDEARAVAREAIAVRRALLAHAPDDATYRSALVADLGLAGRLDSGSGDAAGALATWREALAIAREGAAKPGADVVARHDLALSLFLVGSQSARLKDAAAALALLAEAQPIAEALAREAPADPGPARLAGMIGRALGETRLAGGDRDGALAAFLAARDADVAAQTRAPGDAADAARVKIDVDRIGFVADEELLARDFAGALAAIDQATPAAPEQNWLDLVRAAALMFLDRTAEAEAVLVRRRGETTALGTPWEREVLAAIGRLKQKGLVHPFMAEIEARFAAAR